MNTLVCHVWCLLALHLAAPAVAGDGIQIVKEPNGKAVQAALDACAAQGGGVAYLPPGRYVSGPLWLKDNVELRLEGGATVVLSPDKTDWPGSEPALVNAKGAKYIAIAGRGTFDGNAQWECRPVFREDPEIKGEQENAQRAGVEMKRYYRTGEVQKRLFLLRNCEGVRLEGITIRNAPLWNVHLQDCNRIWVRGIYLYSDLERAVNSDGIDIVSSANVLISDSIICTADDAICLKTSAWDRRSTERVRPTENITIANLRVKMLAENLPDKRATHALVFQDIEGLTLRGVAVSWDREKPEPKWGSALVLRDVSNLTLQDFQGQAAVPDAPAILKENVTVGKKPL
jgi:polygalacturonase